MLEACLSLPVSMATLQCYDDKRSNSQILILLTYSSFSTSLHTIQNELEKPVSLNKRRILNMHNPRIYGGGNQKKINRNATELCFRLTAGNDYIGLIWMYRSTMSAEVHSWVWYTHVCVCSYGAAVFWSAPPALHHKSPGHMSLWDQRKHQCERGMIFHFSLFLLHYSPGSPPLQPPPPPPPRLDSPSFIVTAPCRADMVVGNDIRRACSYDLYQYRHFLLTSAFSFVLLIGGADYGVCVGALYVAIPERAFCRSSHCLNKKLFGASNGSCRWYIFCIWMWYFL